jgi:hypothetical protein
MLLLSALWATAQYDPQPSASDQNSMGKTTIQGCLSQSNGNYTLTDSSGTAYQVTGETAKLQNHVGHTIQVTGTTGSSSDSGSAMSKQSGSMSGPSDAQHTLAMTSFKHVTAGCTSAK